VVTTGRTDRFKTKIANDSNPYSIRIEKSTEKIIQTDQMSLLNDYTARPLWELIVEGAQVPDEKRKVRIFATPSTIHAWIKESYRRVSWTHLTSKPLLIATTYMSMQRHKADRRAIKH